MEQAQNSFSDPRESSQKRTKYIYKRKMIESELKLAQMTRNLENHNRTTAYERSEINGYLNGYKGVPQTLHSASELVHIHRQEHSKALGTIIHKSHNIKTLIFHQHFYLHFCWPGYISIMWDVGILICFADQRLYFVTQIEKLVI